MTVVYPSWNVTVERNRSAMNIVTLTAGPLDQSTATAIPGGYEYTVVTSFADTGANQLALRLPSDAEIGDAIEVHSSLPNAGTLRVFPPTGESINGTAANTEVFVAALNGRIFRKTASASWATTGS